MESLWKDVQYSIRLFGKDLKLTIVIVVIMAVGLGIGASIFSMVNAALFRPLPVKNADQLVVMATKLQRADFPSYLTYPEYKAYRDTSHAFSDLSAYMNRAVNFSTEADAERIYVEVVTNNYFSMLGVEPLLGQAFQPTDNEIPGGNPVVMLSYSFWQRQFNGEPSIIGKSIRLNGHRFSVIGITPADFPGTEFLLRVDAYVPLMMLDHIWPDHPSQDDPFSRPFRVMGRLERGVSIDQCRASLNTILAHLQEMIPDSDRGASALVWPETHARPEVSLASSVPAVALAFMAFLALILLMVCISVVNLLLARSITRHREVAIRLALGSSRLRLIRQLVTETVLLTLFGGAVGMLVTFWLTSAIRGAGFPTGAPTHFDLRPDWRVFVFTLLLTLLTGIVAGLVPACDLSKPDLHKMLKEDGRGVMVRTRHRLASSLVVSQIALSLLLLICTGMFLRSLWNSEKVDLGFRTKDLLLLSVDVGLQGYRKAQGEDFYQQIQERVESLPGVESASIAYLYPFSTRGAIAMDVFKGDTTNPEADRIRAHYNYVGLNYFHTVGTPLVRGRDFNKEDNESAPLKVVINEAIAERVWHGEDPIGKTLRLERSDGAFAEVVGVAKDGKYVLPNENRRSFMYLPISQHYQSEITLHVHSSTDTASLVSAIRQQIRRLDANLPAYDIVTMERNLRRGYAFMTWRLGSTVVGTYGLLGFLMAVLGVYGTVSYSMKQRMKEIGIRISLGASRLDIYKLIIKYGFRLVLAGVVVGNLAAFGCTRFLDSVVYGISVTDPVSFIVATIGLASAALLACSLPSWRATRTDPMKVLHNE